MVVCLLDPLREAAERGLELKESRACACVALLTTSFPERRNEECKGATMKRLVEVRTRK